MRKIAIGMGALAIGLLGAAGCAPAPDTEPSATLVDDSAITPVKDFAEWYSTEMGIGTAVGDVNLDGLDDMVIGSPYAVKYFQNTGNGEFYEVQTVCAPKDFAKWYSTDMDVELELAHFDEDVHLDLLVVTPYATQIFYNEGGIFVQH